MGLCLCMLLGTFLNNYDVIERKLQPFQIRSTVEKGAKRMPDIIVETPRNIKVNRKMMHLRSSVISTWFVNLLYNKIFVFLLQWGSEIRKHFKSGLFEGWISIGPVFKWSSFSYGYSTNHSKTGPFKIQMFLSGFQMYFDKIATICPDFKWFGFQISDPIWNLDHLQPNLYSTIRKSGFQIPTVYFYTSVVMLQKYFCI